MNDNALFANSLYFNIESGAILNGDGIILAAPHILYYPSQCDPVNIVMWSVGSYVWFSNTDVEFQGCILALDFIDMEPNSIITWVPPSSSAVPPFDFSSSQYRIVYWEETHK